MKVNYFKKVSIWNDWYLKQYFIKNILEKFLAGNFTCLGERKKNEKKGYQQSEINLNVQRE